VSRSGIIAAHANAYGVPADHPITPNRSRLSASASAMTSVGQSGDDVARLRVGSAHARTIGRDHPDVLVRRRIRIGDEQPRPGHAVEVENRPPAEVAPLGVCERPTVRQADRVIAGGDPTASLHPVLLRHVRGCGQPVAAGPWQPGDVGLRAERPETKQDGND
jgi:hypothetical protein